MPAFVVTFLVGVVCVILGMKNRKGDISSLHSYHRRRVSEEDRIPFGKQVGLGTILVGVGVMVFSVMSAITLYTEQEIFILIGTGAMIAGLVVGMAICFRAMIRYNKGIF